MKTAYDSEYFEPGATLECGQVFRYYQVRAQDYYVISSDKRARVFFEDGKTHVETDYPAYFHNYFDMEADYGQAAERLRKFEELEQPLSKGRGIRILRQDLFETVISFIISANNNIPRIRSIIERLCMKYGALKQDSFGTYYAFPTIDALKTVDTQTYRALGCGFRDSYLYETVMAVCTSDILERIRAADTRSAGKLLCSLKGIGQKVADCVTLFALHRGDCYPVDTWIFKANRTPELNTPQKVRAHYLERYGSDAGYAQQLIFYKAKKAGL